MRRAAGRPRRGAALRLPIAKTPQRLPEAPCRALDEDVPSRRSSNRLGCAKTLETLVDPRRISPSAAATSHGHRAWVQFRVQYFVYALLFVVFDVEVIFIFPWALVWRQLGPVGLWAMIVFLGILAVGLAYEWKKGALEWK